MRQTVALFYGLKALEHDFPATPDNAMKPNQTLKFAGLLACTFLATAGFMTAQEATAPKIPADLEARRAAAIKKAEVIREELMKAASAPRPQLTVEQKAKAAEAQATAEKELAKRQAESFAEIKKIEAAELPRYSYLAQEFAAFEQDTKARMASLHTRMTEKHANDMAAARRMLEGSLFPEKFTDSDGHSRLLGGLEGDRPMFMGSHNVISAQTISSDQFRPFFGKMPLQLKGAGTVMGVWEIADPKSAHTEFLNSAGTVVRLVDKDGAYSAGQADKDHATHVSGTLTARGVDANALGMSPEATLNAYNPNDDTTDMTSIFTNSDPSDNLLVSNHSYGFKLGWDSSLYAHPTLGNMPIWWGDVATSAVEDSNFGYYGAKAQALDQIVFTRKTYLPVWAAGNDRLQSVPYTHPSNYFVGYYSVAPAGFYVFQGAYPGSDGGSTGYDTTSLEGVAKNILTVGSVADIPEGYKPGVTTVNPSSFSNAGPTDDGRVKPDVVANGESLYSSADSVAYGYLTGTSMASPSVSGSINLLNEYFKRLYGPNRLPWASTIKGVVIHTADDFGTAGPDYRSGWGLMNTMRAALYMQQNVMNNSPVWREITLANSSTHTIQITAVQGAVVPIKVTIAWTDPAATPLAPSLDNTSTRLVNDVDLWITKPDSSIARPYILNRTSPASAATTGVNSVDNVEQVVITNPIPGATYTINIAPASGETFVNDAGSPAPQDVSVFITGAQPDPMNTKLVWNGGSSYSFTWTAKQGNVYRLETSTDLFDWVEISGDIVPSTTQTLSHTPGTTSGTKRFWRPKRVNN